MDSGFRDAPLRLRSAPEGTVIDIDQLADGRTQTSVDGKKRGQDIEGSDSIRPCLRIWPGGKTGGHDTEGRPARRQVMAFGVLRPASRTIARVTLAISNPRFPSWRRARLACWREQRRLQIRGIVFPGIPGIACVALLWSALAEERGAAVILAYLADPYCRFTPPLDLWFRIPAPRLG